MLLPRDVKLQKFKDKAWRDKLNDLAQQPNNPMGALCNWSTKVIYDVVAPENEQPFLQAMSWVRGSRLRTGATEWGLYRDGEAAHRFVEFFVVPSWEEHLRQHHERLTDFDRRRSTITVRLKGARDEHRVPVTGDFWPVFDRYLLPLLGTPWKGVRLSSPKSARQLVTPATL